MVGRQPGKGYGSDRGEVIGKDPGVRLYLQRLASGSEASTWSVYMRRKVIL